MALDNSTDTGDCGCAPRVPVKSCGFPPTPPTCTTVTPAPVCPEPVVECPVTFLPYEEPPCVPECGPCTEVEECVGCDWTQECIVSVPPPLPCAPINVGWGQYDGGLMYWARRVCCDDPCGAERHGSNEVIRDYLQHNWHHVLDLSQYDQMYTDLPVFRNGMLNHASPQEFVSLTAKIAQTAVCLGMLQPPTPIPVADQFGLNIKNMGTDAAGLPLFGLTLTYAGAAIGTPLPLEAHWDATGEATALTFPASLLPNLP